MLFFNIYFLLPMPICTEIREERFFVCFGMLQTGSIPEEAEQEDQNDPLPSRVLDGDVERRFHALVFDRHGLAADRFGGVAGDFAAGRIRDRFLRAVGIDHFQLQTGQADARVVAVGVCRLRRLFDDVQLGRDRFCVRRELRRERHILCGHRRGHFRRPAGEGIEKATGLFSTSCGTSDALLYHSIPYSATFFAAQLSVLSFFQTTGRAAPANPPNGMLHLDKLRFSRLTASRLKPGRLKTSRGRSRRAAAGLF